MTTPLDTLKTVLEAKVAAEREWEKHADVLVPSEESRHAALIVGRARNRMVGILTDDTIAALIATVEAADELVGWRGLEKYSIDPDWSADVARVKRHLAPLVKGDTDVRG